MVLSIPLTRGKFALIDEDDLALVNGNGEFARLNFPADTNDMYERTKGI